MLRARLLFILFFVSTTVFAQFPEIPEPDIELYEVEEFATPDAEYLLEPELVPHSEVYNFLSTAVANVNQLPEDLTSNNGTSLIQNESATQLMSYAKWMFSDVSARELLGETLAPIGINLYLLLTLIVFLTIAWATLRIATLIFRFVLFIVREILRILPFVG